MAYTLSNDLFYSNSSFPSAFITGLPEVVGMAALNCSVALLVCR